MRAPASVSPAHSRRTTRWRGRTHGPVLAIYLGRIDEAFALALESAKARDGVGHMWVRFPDIEPMLAHPRYPEILARLGADAAT